MEPCENSRKLIQEKSASGNRCPRMTLGQDTQAEVWIARLTSHSSNFQKDSLWFDSSHSLTRFLDGRGRSQYGFFPVFSFPITTTLAPDLLGCLFSLFCAFLVASLSSYPSLSGCTIQREDLVAVSNNISQILAMTVCLPFICNIFNSSQ